MDVRTCLADEVMSQIIIAVPSVWADKMMDLMAFYISGRPLLLF
jgi:hypothetical protein